MTRAGDDLIRQILAVLPEHDVGGTLSAGEIREAIGGRWHDRSVRFALAQLVAEQRVVFTGPNRHRRYKLPRRPGAVGVAASSGGASLGVSSQTSAGRSPERPAASLEDPSASAIRALAESGLTDRQIGAKYRRPTEWAAKLRRRYGIAAGFFRRGHVLEREPARPAVVSDTQFAAAITALGGYTDITDAEKRALLRRRPPRACGRFSKLPPHPWVPREAMT